MFWLDSASLQPIVCAPNQLCPPCVGLADLRNPVPPQMSHDSLVSLAPLPYSLEKYSPDVTHVLLDLSMCLCVRIVRLYGEEFRKDVLQSVLF